MHQQLTGRILSSEGWIEGSIIFTREGRIQAILPHFNLSAEEKSRILLPGFIDVHVHGGGGVDVMEGGNAANLVAKVHARHGTTSLLATTMTAPMLEIDKVMGDIGRTCRQRSAGEARILGVHLEGPFINPGKLGAQPQFSVAATLSEIDVLRNSHLFASSRSRPKFTVISRLFANSVNVVCACSLATH